MSTDYLFVGDSITDAGRDRDDPASLGDGYVALLAEQLSPASVRNAGVAGDRARDLERRWAADVLPLVGGVLTLYVGVNDTWRRFDSADPTSPEQFLKTTRGLLRAVVARAPQTRLILMEPFLVPVRAEQETWLDDLAGKRGVIHQLAQEFTAPLVELNALFTAQAALHGPAALAPDGVHPTPRGSRLIADAWLEHASIRRAANPLTIVD